MVLPFAQEFVPRFSIGTYPNNGDVVFLAAVLPWRSDAFVRLVNVPCLAQETDKLAPSEHLPAWEIRRFRDLH